MAPGRYKRIGQVSQAALSQPPESVESSLREACAGDRQLLRLRSRRVRRRVVS